MAASALQPLIGSISRVLLGKERQVRLALACLLARGHLLIEDLPGVGKSTLAEALARSFALDFRRVSFTSDLLPADLTGVNVFDPATARFQFRPGPLFAQVLLADEINRASPRTQSALLEAMAAGRVSVDGSGHPLPRP
ncbi:MAG: AAA family ATPase, partial [Cyanobium sp.]